MRYIRSRRRATMPRAIAASLVITSVLLATGCRTSRLGSGWNHMKATGTFNYLDHLQASSKASQDWKLYTMSSDPSVGVGGTIAAFLGPWDFDGLVETCQHLR